MRRVRDRDLPDPFRAWIDRDQPLPPDVVVLPREILVSSEVWGFAYTAFIFLVMGVLSTIMFGPALFEPLACLVPFFALWYGILIGVPLRVAHKLWRTVQADRDRKAGVLRQGVLVGRAGVLVRLTPNQCYPIPMNRFVTAKEWTGGGEDAQTWVVLETRDGEVNVYADRLSFGAGEVNRAVTATRR